MPAKQPPRWMAPALPVFAGAPAPTGIAKRWANVCSCGSGFTREKAIAVYGTGFTGVRG